MFVEVLDAACEEELNKIAESIEKEMKGVLGKHHQTGAAEGAVHIEKGHMSAFVGGTDGTGSGVSGTDHMAMLNDGNGSRTIYPKNARVLRYHDGSLHGSSRPYAGIHFVEEIASHYK